MTDTNEIDGVVDEPTPVEETAAPDAAADAAPVEEAPVAAPPAEEPAAVAEEPAAATEEPAAPAEEPAAAEVAAETEPVDPARQAEIDALAAELQGGAIEKPAKRTRRASTKRAAAPAPEAEAAAEPAAEPSAEAPTDAETATEAPERAEGAEPETTEDADESEEGGEAGARRSRSRRGRNRSRAGEKPAEEGQAGASGQGAAAAGEDRQDRNQDRNRNRKRGPGRNDDEIEPEILPDDVLIPIAGILDVLDNYAFVRTTGYLPGVTDVYVSLGQVKKYGLRKGDAVVGAIRQPREGESQGRQKYNALVRVDSVNGQGAEASLARPEFAAGTPVRPSAPLTIKTTAKGVALGKGQRALVVGGSGSGKTRLIAEVAESVSANHPDAHLMVVLAGARPEEATDFRRKVKGEVIVSTFDQAAEDLVTVVELAVERAKRLVELGLDVVVLIDSVTQLGRAYFSLAPVSRAHADDPTFLLPAKRLLGAARAIEDGASLTIVATGSADLSLDQLAVTELSTVANAVVRLG